MALDHGRYFLLSLLMTPACTDRSVDEDGEPERKLGDGCRALFEHYMSCYEDVYDTGYASESGGDYDPASYCDYLQTELVQEYGEPCARAVDDVYACLATLDCSVLGAGTEEACREEQERGRKSCPEVFPPCECAEFGASDGSCGLDCIACVDGNDYTIECTPVASDGTSMCTCRENGEVTEELTGVMDACFDVSTLARESCMFP
jgi:hypothetical protein